MDDLQNGTIVYIYTFFNYVPTYIYWYSLGLIFVDCMQFGEWTFHRWLNKKL